MTFTWTSLADTDAFAVRLAAALRPGDVVALAGNLGAGKTRLVQGLAHACGVAPHAVTSPTFTLIHEYAGTVRLRHCDAYRLKHPDEFADLGLDELFAEDGVALVEWADRVAEYLPRDHVQIEISATGRNERTVTVRATGPRSQRVVAEL